MGVVVVDRLFDGSSSDQLVQVFGQQVVVEGQRMVVVDLGSLFERHIAKVLVVRVLRDQADRLVLELIKQLLGHRRFS
jgi:hypothetical protein